MRNKRSKNLSTELNAVEIFFWWLNIVSGWTRTYRIQCYCEQMSYLRGKCMRIMNAWECMSRKRIQNFNQVCVYVCMSVCICRSSCRIISVWLNFIIKLSIDHNQCVFAYFCLILLFFLGWTTIYYAFRLTTCLHLCANILSTTPSKIVNK